MSNGRYVFYPFCFLSPQGQYLIPVLQNSYDGAIAKNTNLQSLTVLASGFTFCDSDPQWYHLGCTKCKIKRVEATRTLAMTCTKLESCKWGHGTARFSFNVRLSRKSSGGQTLVRVRVISVASGYACMSGFQRTDLW